MRTYNIHRLQALKPKVKYARARQHWKATWKKKLGNSALAIPTAAEQLDGYIKLVTGYFANIYCEHVHPHLFLLFKHIKEIGLGWEWASSHVEAQGGWWLS